MLKESRLNSGPSLIVLAHQVAVSPRPVDTSREKESLLACGTQLEPIIHIQIGEEI
jgi:hypothetical protein